jgi:hypothetical protein
MTTEKSSIVKPLKLKTSPMDLIVIYLKTLTYLLKQVNALPSLVKMGLVKPHFYDV